MMASRIKSSFAEYADISVFSFWVFIALDIAAIRVGDTLPLVQSKPLGIAKFHRVPPHSPDCERRVASHIARNRFRGWHPRQGLPPTEALQDREYFGPMRLAFGEFDWVAGSHQ
jgi:hypothetical protein